MAVSAPCPGIFTYTVQNIFNFCKFIVQVHIHYNVTSSYIGYIMLIVLVAASLTALFVAKTPLLFLHLFLL